MEIKSSFEGENMETENSVLGHRIDLYYHIFNLQQQLMKINITTEILTMKHKRQKAIEQELGFEFITMDPDK